MLNHEFLEEQKITDQKLFLGDYLVSANLRLLKFGDFLFVYRLDKAKNDIDLKESVKLSGDFQ